MGSFIISHEVLFGSDRLFVQGLSVVVGLFYGKVLIGDDRPSLILSTVLLTILVFKRCMRGMALGAEV